MQLSKLVSTIKNFTTTNSPVILTVAASVGVVALGISAAHAGFKAGSHITKVNQNRHPEDPEITMEDYIRLTWKNYITPVSIGVGTIIAIVSNQMINRNRQLALMGAYTLTDAAFREYKESTTEVFGKNANQKVMDSVATKKVEESTPTMHILNNDSSKVLCMDSITGRYFASDVETIRQAQNTLNAEIINHGYASANDFYSLINLDRIASGDDIGWNSNHLLDICFTSALASDNKPCIVLNYNVLPSPGYYKNN